MPKLSPKKQEELTALIKKAKYLYHAEGYSYRAIGEQLGKSYEWVRKAIFTGQGFGKKDPTRDVDN